MLLLGSWFRRHARDVAAYAGVALASVVICVVVLDLRHADLRVPFCYSGSDGYYTLEFAKNIQETGSVGLNPRVAAPLDHENFGDPQLLAVTILPMRFLFLFARDFGSVVNLYFLLGFPLTALAALYALRALGFSYFAASVPALLYAFLPFHMWRGEDHILPATYLVVPLVALTALWIAGGTPLFRWSAGKKLPGLTRAGILSIVFCILLGCDYPYYTFFGILLFLLAAAYAWFALRDWRVPFTAAVLSSITVAAYAVSVLPYLVARGSALPFGDIRSPREAEFYGLKIVQLLMPIQFHRLGAFADFRSYYDATAPLVTENSTASLGFVGALGFLLLLGAVLFPLRRRVGDVVHQSAVLNLGCFLFATVGGFAVIFNYLVSPDLRSYNRIVVFIAFFSFVAVAWSLETIRERLLRNESARRLGIAGLALLLCLGIADQSSPKMVSPYEGNAATYRSDQAFVRKIEGSLPAGAAVFELPYVPWAGSLDLVPWNVSPYWLFKGYLHSNALRWSFGTAKGSDDDAWLRSLSALPVARLLPELVLANFGGIYIARNLYNDQRAERALESDLTKRLGQTPTVSDDGALAFYSLAGFRAAEISRLGEAGFERARALVPPLLPRVVSGCRPTVRSERSVWRWCGNHAVIAITNLTTTPKVGVLSGEVADRTVAGTLDVRSGAQRGQIPVSPKSERMRITLTAPPGTSFMEFDANLPVQRSLAGPESFFFKNVKLLDSATNDATDFYND
jgi:phosphoglycerol transferase